MANSNLNKAKKKKDDEFYTQLTDIEREVWNYKDHLKDKVVFLNCDDPEESNFWKYFEMKFKDFGLKKLIATHYNSNRPGYKLEILEDDSIVRTSLKQNGDFRSEESVELLKESDIVVTNPPFSLFREYVVQLLEYEKKFLIIGPKNAIGYNEIFPSIKSNSIWLGINMLNNFTSSTDTIKTAPGYWYTNLDYGKRHEDLVLYKKYNPADYPSYSNYDAIEVNKTKNIPDDYYQLMGVPISYLHKHNPDQFSIEDFVGVPLIAGRVSNPYKRLIIKRRSNKEDR